MTQQQQMRARRRRLRRAGMTLVEIMIVVIIMALIATGVAVAVLPRLRQAKIDSTRTDLRTVQSAAEQYIADPENHNQCPPNVDALVPNYLNSSGRRVDAWNQPFSIVCDGSSVTITSGGPDEQMGTEDDIH